MQNEEISIIVVDDDEFSLENIQLTLNSFGYNIELSSTYDQAIELLSNKKFHIAIVDLYLPRQSGIDVIETGKNIDPELQFILVTGYSDESAIVKAVKLGVIDIIKKPYQEAELSGVVERIIEKMNLERENAVLRERLHRENIILRDKLISSQTDEFAIVGKSEELKHALEKAMKISAHSVNSLIYGETGTGKELLARFIHRNGPRSEKPFIPINCAELSPSLFESELFGHKKGTFTDARDSRAGLIETANRGILFLDEITEIPPGLQAKLLRVVETQKVRRLGEVDWMNVDVQFLSSTNRDIDEILQESIFREDLFHRLSDTIINLPPLRERDEDIDLLIEHFINKYSIEYNLDKIELPEEIVSKIKNERWPGNIRQFSNFIKNWCLFGNDAEAADIDRWLRNATKDNQPNSMCFQFHKGTFDELNDAKEWLVNKTLKKFHGNKSRAAEHLGLSYAGLLKMIKGMDKKNNN